MGGIAHRRGRKEGLEPFDYDISSFESPRFNIPTPFSIVPQKGAPYGVSPKKGRSVVCIVYTGID